MSHSTLVSRMRVVPPLGFIRYLACEDFGSGTPLQCKLKAPPFRQSLERGESSLGWDSLGTFLISGAVFLMYPCKGAERGLDTMLPFRPATDNVTL